MMFIALTVRNEETLSYFLAEIGMLSFVHYCKLLMTMT